MGCIRDFLATPQRGVLDVPVTMICNTPRWGVAKKEISLPGTISGLTIDQNFLFLFAAAFALFASSRRIVPVVGSPLVADDRGRPITPDNRPMRTIALMNQKGGVGKTTTTVNLGAALAEAGHRVVLIDLDPQAHLTINYGVEPTAELAGLYDVLVHEVPIAEVIQSVGDRLLLVPSSIDLAAAEVELVSVLGRELILKKRLEAAALDADFVLLDCPPSLGLLTINALAAASEVIVPMQPHFLALQGVAKLLETVQLVNKRMNPALKVTGVALTMFDGQAKLSTEVVNELKSFITSAEGKPLPWARAKIFNTRIRRNIKLAESPSFGQTILKYDTGSNGAADYRSLAAEVAAMV
jgi:chromosome partitioning protein